jgi:hypothetical protein
MGVDISMVVRIIDPSTNASYDVKVTDQDNAFSSLFFSNNISYTKISWDKTLILSEEEMSLWRLNETDEMMAESPVMDAGLASSILYKIDSAIFTQKRTALLGELKTGANTQQGDQTDRIQRQILGEYFGFSTSFDLVHGILKAAETLNWKVQFVGHMY